MDVAAKALSLIRERKPFGIYHIANQGRVDYFTFFDQVASNLQFKANRLINTKPEIEFNSPEPNPIFTPLSSIKIEPLRPWKEALGDFLYGYLL
jgi:dTDP-4-dehydrorhamnose reductase